MSNRITRNLTRHFYLVYYLEASIIDTSIWESTGNNSDTKQRECCEIVFKRINYNTNTWNQPVSQDYVHQRNVYTKDTGLLFMSYLTVTWESWAAMVSHEVLLQIKATHYVTSEERLAKKKNGRTAKIQYLDHCYWKALHHSSNILQYHPHPWK